MPLRSLHICNIWQFAALFCLAASSWMDPLNKDPLLCYRWDVSSTLCYEMFQAKKAKWPSQGHQWWSLAFGLLYWLVFSIKLHSKLHLEKKVLYWLRLWCNFRGDMSDRDGCGEWKELRVCPLHTNSLTVSILRI